MNARVPTDRPIQAHVGSMPGQGDLTDAFAWGDPIVKITVQRVEQRKETSAYWRLL